MSQATFSVRMDETVKIEFETLCRYFGMNLNTAINIFARAVIKEKKMPFEISAPDLFSAETASNLFGLIRQQAVSNGVADMSMDEIDAEIADTRKGIGR